MATGRTIAATDVSTRTIPKIRIRLIPLLFLLYVVAFLDRVNIGFAALTMNAELAITSAKYGLIAGIFFWGYFIFEIPSNLLLHRIGARIWIARILIMWGIVATATGAVHSVPQLYATRFLLGVAEAGFFPGIMLYLTYWFPQRDLAGVIALFVSALPVESIFGAPLSGVILDHAHWAGISSWRWLLILEGLPAIVCGILTYFLLPTVCLGIGLWWSSVLTRRSSRRPEKKPVGGRGLGSEPGLDRDGMAREGGRVRQPATIETL